MSEKGQKIFKWIVWIAIILVFVLVIGNKIYVAAHPAISKTECLNMVSDSFGIEDPSVIDPGGEEDATGEYTAVTSMRALGSNNVYTLTGETNPSDEQLVKKAIKYKFIKKRDLDKKFSKDKVNKVLSKVIDFYLDPSKFPEYCDIEYNCDVVDTQGWVFEELDEENDIVYVTFDGDIPQEGQVLIYRDEYGIAYAKYVGNCSQLEDNRYKIQLEQIEDISKVINTLSFSGAADFSYLLNQKPEESQEEVTEEAKNTATQGTASVPLLLCSMYPNRVLALSGVKEWVEDKTSVSGDWKTQGIDIELSGKGTLEEKNGEDSANVSGYIKVTASNGTETKYEVKVDDSGKVTFTAVKNDCELEFEKEEESKPKEDKFEKKAGITDSFSYTVNVDNFSLLASGYFQTLDWGDEKNHIDVRASADVKTKTTLSAEYEKKVPIAELPIPIAATGGVVSVNLKLYLVVSVNGEVNLEYEVVDAYTGVKFTSAQGFSTPHGHGYEHADFTSKVQLGLGVCGEASVKAFCWDIIDPGVDVKAQVTAETLERNEGFEDYEQCVQAQLAAPLVTLEASAGEDSVLYKLLDAFNVTAKAQYDLITEDNAPFKKEFHIETDLEGKITMIDGDKSVCTHMFPEQKADLAEDMKQQLSDETQNAKEDAEVKVQEAIEAAIENWFKKNCQGCN